MGYSRKKKELRKKQHKTSPFTGIRKQWGQKRPVIYFVLGFSVLIVLFYLVWTSDFYINQIQPHILVAYNGISSSILNLFGMETQTSGSVLFSSSFSIDIKRGCDGLEAMALFASTLLVFPAKWRSKLIGFFSGIAILFILNIVRIVSLFITGIYYPKAFEFMHVEFWQALFIFFAIALLIFWIRWSRKMESHVA